MSCEPRTYAGTRLGLAQQIVRERVIGGGAAVLRLIGFLSAKSIDCHAASR